jgi:hypothetical protein
MDTLTACPKCVADRGAEKTNEICAIIYIDAGLGRCDKHGEMTVKEMMGISSELGLSQNQDQQH